MVKKDKPTKDEEGSVPHKEAGSGPAHARRDSTSGHYVAHAPNKEAGKGPKKDPGPPPVPVEVLRRQLLEKYDDPPAVQQAAVRYEHAGEWVAWLPDFSGVAAHAPRFEEFVAAARATGRADLVFEHVPPVPTVPLGDES